MDALTRDLLALPRLGAGVGLHRAAALVAGLGVEPWWTQCEAIKVTGSNGKGSTVAFVEAIGEALGLSTGAFTSPHLRTLDERFRVRGERVSAPVLQAVGERVLDGVAACRKAHLDDAVGVFEALFAVGVGVHAACEVALPVYEAGIGGRFDPTRLLPGDVAVLTSVDLEHTALLGSDLFSIAANKADLAPAGGTLIVGPIDAELRRRLQVYCQVRQVRPVFVTDEARVQELRLEGTGMVAAFRVGDVHLDELFVALPGRHQLDNLCCAVLAIRAWLTRTGRSVSVPALATAVRRAAAQVYHPYRFEQVATAPPVWVDGAYTPGAVAALNQLVAARSRAVALVLGASRGRDLAGLASSLVPMATHIVCSEARHRGAPTAAVAAAVEATLQPGQTLAVAPLEGALEQARAWALANDGEVVVAGGLFLAAEAAQRLRGEWREDILLL